MDRLEEIREAEHQAKIAQIRAKGRGRTQSQGKGQGAVRRYVGQDGVHAE